MSGHPSTLVEQLKGGLDAPICLTWELTYACNLECVHCLSSSGRRDPRELTTAEAKAVLDELHALQVFYINIGGGEPMIRRDFFELLEYSIGLGIGVKFSTNGAFIDAAKARRLAAMDYLDIQISLDGTDAADERRRARRRLVRHGHPGDGAPPRRGLRSVQDLRGRHPSQRRPTRRVQGARRLVRRAAAGHPAAPVGSRRRLVARPAPDQRPAATDLRLARGQRRQRPDRRLVLPPQRARGGAVAGSEHVRRRPRRVSDRPDRRRLRLPVRDPRRVQGRLRPRRRWIRPRVAAQRAVRRTARAAVGGRLRVVRQLRRLPGRLHGGEVLHRPARSTAPTPSA